MRLFLIKPICVLTASILLFMSSFTSPCFAAWNGTTTWQNVKLGSPDTFLHLLVGDLIGVMVQTNFQEDDRHTQFVKALLISLSLGMLKESMDMYQQYKSGKPLNLPDSIKDMAMNFLGVFISFNFDSGAPKKSVTAAGHTVDLEEPFEGAPLLEDNFALRR